MNFVRRREVKGIKKNVEKENEKRMNKKKKRKKKRGRKEYSFAVVEVTEVTLKFRGILQIAICNAAKEKLLLPRFIPQFK